MAVQQNRFSGYGYPVLTNATTGTFPRLRWFTIPGCKHRILLRDGAVGFLIVHFATWWHRRIHRLDAAAEPFDEWGYADRPVRDSATVISEHATGQAADLDASLHPRGVPLLRTFKRWQIAKIRLRLKLYRGCLGWGGDYQRTVDGMHVERAYGVSMARCERVAKLLFRTPIGQAVLKANPGLRKVIES